MTRTDYVFGDIQKLFVILCDTFQRMHFVVKAPSYLSETVQLFMPSELEIINEQIGAIQYGGENMKSKDALKLKYVELRLKVNVFKELNCYDALYELIGETDAYGWLKYKFTYCKKDLLLFKQVSTIISRYLEKEYGVNYLMIGLDPAILQLPRTKV